MTSMNIRRIEKAIREILKAIGEDPGREGLRETPGRVARMYAEVFSGIGEDPAKLLKVFHAENHQEMVIVKSISLYSICEHHLIPFMGEAHVAYIPGQGKVTGLSKLARVVDVLAKRPQVQERLTTQIAETLMERLNPKGVLVIIEAEHLCMSMRGVRKPGSITVTSAVRGVLRKSASTRAEALALIRGGVR